MRSASTRLGAIRAGAILELHADLGANAESIARETRISAESVRAVLRGQTYRRLSRSMPIQAGRGELSARVLDGMLDRRLTLITAHRRWGEQHRLRRAP